MISKATIDTVFETARVEEVIGDFVQLKRAGSNFKGLSPFSDERSPSFMVSPAKGIWKDFSSGKGGNSVAFLMEHEHFTYPEAIRYLAKKYNIEIEETELTDAEKANTDLRESMYLVSDFAKDYFYQTLLKSEEGKAIGLSYFKERGFTAETIEKFSLGYSPEAWDAFTKEALGKGYKLEFLESTGLTIPREDRPFDRFKGRVMFPIQSMSGRTLGFGGRILTNDKKAAKYLNSPESDIYHKSKVLYGIYHAKQAIAKQNNCFLVEGYTDVIQFHQSGIENVVASSGTALTPDQIRLINRLTKNITVLFDGDAAGLRASIRGIDLILEEGMNVKVCSFPDGEDPDSFAKKTSHDDLVAYLDENAKDFIQFKASLLMKEAKNDPIKKADLIRDMVVSISKIPDRIQREIYVQECSRIMDISEQVLQSTLAQLVQKDSAELVKTEKKESEQKAFNVIKNQNPAEVQKVDILYR
ncbi:DNA primase, partial [Flavobacterium sp.]|uniref:DNA primase n=1 Tax=Flavobacterium sp. TaxID=239 RepID=UPI002614C259